MSVYIDVNWLDLKDKKMLVEFNQVSNDATGQRKISQII